MGLGKLLGKIVAAPIRIITLPEKVISKVFGNESIFDDLTEAIEDSVEEIIDDKK